MKLKTATVSIIALVVLSTALVHTYRRGYSDGSANERLHWLVSYEDGVWTAVENPQHPILSREGGEIRLKPQVMVNSIPAQHSP